MDKGVWQSDAIFHSRDGKDRRRKKKRKRYYFSGKDTDFLQQKMPLVFPKCFVLWKKKQRRDLLLQRASVPIEYEFQHFQRKQGKRYVDGEKPFPISEKKKNFLSSQKEGICVSPSSVGRIIKRKPSFCPKKYVARRKKKRIRRNEDHLIMKSKRRRLDCSRYRCPPRKRKEEIHHNRH